MPSRVTGTENSNRVAKKDATVVPTERPLKACRATPRIGLATKGTAAMVQAAASTIRPRLRRLGCRSAILPPSQ